MAHPHPSPISSNWKKLQEKLKSEKVSSTNTGTKRKREAEKSTHRNSSIKKNVTGFKKTKLDPRRPPKMGTILSTTSTTSRLTTDHDIPAADITAAYGPSAPLPRPSHPPDTPNTGLHPTHKLGKYVALDCEMVGTGPPPHLDHVLARVSLVNFHGEQIYDSYVQPPPTVRVHDYRTAVSGIRPHHLRAGVARPFGDVQRDVARVLAGRVLVGHALRNDLSVLMLAHPKRDVRDTSRYAKFRVESKGKPPALRNLARSELGLEIQMGEHSSLEDARVAMLLFAKEKRGFEEENRRVFGRRKGPVVVVVGGKADAKMGKGDTLDVEGDSEEEVEEDLDTLDGEEDEELEDGVPVVKPDAQPKGKKRKKKKRTKRN